MITKEIKQGDVFSELSHYTFKEKNKEGYVFIHHSSKQEVTLGEDYVNNLLVSGNIYGSTVKVGKEDKLWTQKQIDEQAAKGGFPSDAKGYLIPKVGDIRVKGIRTIWEEIHSQHVFTVCYQKAHVELSAKKLKELKDAQAQEAIALIEKAATSKKGVAKAALEAINAIQSNPILPIQEGEDRILTGFKLEFSSRDGKYNCMDMSINEPRPVNINTIKWLIFQNVMYIVE